MAKLIWGGGSGIGIVWKDEAGVGWSTCLVFGHIDEHTHDVDNAVSPGRHIRHREGLVRNRVNFYQLEYNTFANCGNSEVLDSHGAANYVNYLVLFFQRC